MFSLGPIIVIAIAVAGLLFGHDAVTSQVMSSIREMLGDTGAKAVEAMLAGASRPAAGVLATILGIGALLFATIGSGPFYSRQRLMNKFPFQPYLPSGKLMRGGTVRL